MDWKTLGQEIAKIGLPLLGAALPLPGGAAIGTALASMIGLSSAQPQDILTALTANADAVVKAKQFEAQHREKLLEMAYNYEIEQRKADSADVAAVNTTMQTEAANSASEAWYQKAWRPFNGFVVGLGSFVATVFSCYLFYLGILGHDPSAINAVPQLATSIALILGVPGAAVGITAWHRGRAQIAEIQAATK